MSLDIYLHLEHASIEQTSGIFIREDGSTKEISRDEWDKRFSGVEPFVAKESYSDEVFWANITHNLGKMAKEAGIYEYLWRPEEVNINLAAQLIEPLRAGLKLLESDSARFKKFNPSNGWGDYDALVRFVQGYLEACEKYPQATVRVSR